MKCKQKIHYRHVKSFRNYWLTIKSKSVIAHETSTFLNRYKETEDEIFNEDKPLYQEFLTNLENIQYQKIDYSKYEELPPNSLNCRNKYDSFHGILYYIYMYSNNKFNISEIEFHYSGSKSRQNLEKMNKINTCKDQYDIMNIFDYENINKEFIIPCMKDAYFGISFKNVKVSPVSYSIQMGASTNNYCNLICFVFEAYNEDTKKWDVLDERENSNDLTLKGGFVMFFTKKTNQSYSMFRLKQTNTCQNGFWGFSISAFDIHGVVSYREDENEESLNVIGVKSNIENKNNDFNDPFVYDPFIDLSDYVFI